MKEALIHKIGINCSKQRRKETTLDTEVTCPDCLDQLHYKNRFSEENFKRRVYIPDNGFPLLPLPDGEFPKIPWLTIVEPTDERSVARDQQ